MQVSTAPWLVLLSVVLAVEGGYLALGQLMQIEAAAGLRRRLLLAGAAFAFGSALWAMHFTALLAVHPATFYLALPVLLSFFAGVLIAGAAAYAISAGPADPARLAVGSVLLTAAIVIMHGIGVSALPARIVDSLPALIVSVAIAFAGSALALWLAARQGRALAGAIAFGLAVAAAHYVAMAGARLVPTPMLSSAPILSAGMLAIVIALTAFALTALFLLLLVPERAAAPEPRWPRPRAEAAAEEPLAAAPPARAPTTSAARHLRPARRRRRAAAAACRRICRSSATARRNSCRSKTWSRCRPTRITLICSTARPNCSARSPSARSNPASTAAASCACTAAISSISTG